MPLPPWIADQKRKDNWLTVSKVRANAEEANPPAAFDANQGRTQAQTIARFHDDHHDF
jgi:hypothetical protein